MHPVPSFLQDPKSKSTQGCGNKALLHSPDKFLLRGSSSFSLPDHLWGFRVDHKQGEINNPAVMTQEAEAKQIPGSCLLILQDS